MMTEKQQGFINSLINKKEISGELLSNTLFQGFRNEMNLNKLQASQLIEMLLSCEDKKVEVKEFGKEKITRSKIIKELKSLKKDGKVIKVQVSKKGVVRYYNNDTDTLEDLTTATDLIKYNEYELIF